MLVIDASKHNLFEMRGWVHVQEKPQPTLLELKRENEATELIRLLKDQTQSQAVFDRCKQFLGE